STPLFRSVAGGPGAHLFIGRVGGVATRVADRSAVHAGHLPEATLRAPAAAHAEDGDLHPLGPRPPDGPAVDEVGVADLHGLVPSGESLGRHRHGLLVEATEHLDLLALSQTPMTASNSISTSQRGSSNSLTTTMVAAGRMSAKNSPWTFPT